MDLPPNPDGCCNILIVDDMPSNLFVLSRMLSRYGYEVRTVKDASEAFDEIEAKLPDLILLDVMLPKVDGFEICEQLKADAKTRDVPVIFLSGLNETSQKIRGFSVGGVDYITKPFQKEEVMVRVKTHISLYNLKHKLEKQIALRTKEIHYQANLLGNVSDAIISTDLNLKIQSWNKAAEYIYGWKAGEITGMNISVLGTFSQIKSPYDDNKNPSGLLPAESTWQGEVVQKRKDGTDVYIFTSISPLKDDDGNLLGTVSINRDITERKQTEAKIRRLNEELEQRVQERTQELSIANDKLQSAKEVAEIANQAKSQFLANMSHELRTPLNAILGFAQLMTDDHALPQRYRDNLKTIHRSGEHLLTLINGVLDMSKIEAGQTTLNEQSFDLFRVFKEVEDMFRLRVEERGLQWFFICDKTVPQYVCADGVKLRQVLINLLNNALKFTLEGGVSLWVSAVSSIHGKSERITLSFEVRDTGEGIAEDKLDTVFEAFSQTGVGRLIQEGTGLGLPISQKFIRLMGGDIAVESTPGKGSVFRFDVQATSSSATDVEPELQSRRVEALVPGQPVYRLLIADDKEDNRKLLLNLLEPLGFELQEARNGQETVLIYKKWKPHLIWLDMRMPMVDGYEAARQIRALPGGSDVKIVAVTASTFESQRNAVFEAGCDDYLGKPYRNSDIFELIHKHLGVMFIYETQNVDVDASLSRGRVKDRFQIQSDLAAQPAKWRAEILRALILAEPETINALINQVDETYDLLIYFLRNSVDEYSYDDVLSLLEAIEKETYGES